MPEVKRVQLLRPRQGDGGYRVLDIEADVLSNTLSGAPQLVGLAGAIARLSGATEAKGPSAVMVIHENRGLNPYVEDVARRGRRKDSLRSRPMDCPRSAVIRGTRRWTDLQTRLEQQKLRQECSTAPDILKAHALSNGKLGATGFCWGGGTTNSSPSPWGRS